MTARHRLALLGTLATVLVLAGGGSAVLLLYRAALHQEGESLQYVVESQARLVEAVFEWELRDAGGDTAAAMAATLQQFTSAQQHFRGFGRTGEFTVAQLDGDSLRFHVVLRQDAARVPDPIPLPSRSAVHMQRAVAGESGVAVGPDYAGVGVVAAFTHVAGTPLGMVAKRDLIEVRAPYIQAGLAAVGVVVALILIFLLAGSRVGVPLLREVEEREAAHRTILDRFPGVAFRAVADADGAWHFDVFEGAAEALTGWPARRFLDDPNAWADFVGAEAEAALRRCLTVGGGEGRVESTTDSLVVRADGVELSVRTVVRRGETEAEGLICAVGVCQDITEVRAKEDAVARVERALRARRSVDEALVGAGAEEEVWARLCTAVTDAGPYPMAWVGVAAEGAEGTIRAVARAGVDEAHHASAAFSIRADGAVVAALNVYAPDANAFDEREVAHLQGAADAAGRTIELMRSRERGAAIEGRFQAFMDASPVISWLKDAQGRHLWVNHAWEVTYGLDHAGWVGKTDADFLPRSVADSVRGEDLEVLETGRAMSGIRHMATPDGAQRVWRIVKFRLMEAGGLARVGGIAVDMSSEVAVEDALRQSEERLRAALRAGGHGLYDLDLRTGNAEVNDDYARMIGHDPAGFVETNAAWRDRLHPEDRERVYAEYEAYVAGQRDLYRVEFRQRMADRSWKWTLSLGEMVEWDEEGRPVRMVGTHTDIQALKNVEEALRESEARIGTQLDELRRWQAVMLDREDRVQELKREVNEMCRRAGQAPVYPSQVPESSP